MSIELIVISGTRCSGKTFISNSLITEYNEFEIARAVTTRPLRTDDANHYSYLKDTDLDLYKNNNELLTYIPYSQYKYGILKSEVISIIQKNKIPILLIAPECIHQVKLLYKNVMTIYFDADDSILGTRFKDRGETVDDKYLEQLELDRSYYDIYDYLIYNNNIRKNDITSLIYRLYAHYNIGGILDYELIKLMISCGLLVDDYSENNIKGASYDICLGEEYYQDGDLHQLDITNGFIKMHPGDFAIVKSKENFNLPRDICGRFDLRVDMFFKGLILSNVPQIDAGFQGKLFCLLFNPSNDLIQLKYGEPFASIEFTKTLKPTFYYKGKYQKKDTMHDYLDKMIETSAIVQAFAEIKSLKSVRWFEKTLPIIISIISLIAVIVGFIFNPISNIDSKIEQAIDSKLKAHPSETIKDTTQKYNALPNKQINRTP